MTSIHCGQSESRRFRVIVADPPWPFIWRGGPGGRRANKTELGYKTMTVDEIARGLAPKVHQWTEDEDDAALFLWTTQEMLHTGQAREVAERWGFPRRVGELIWRKPNFGAGAFPRAGHETCLLYARSSGSFAGAPRDVHSVQTWKQPYATNGGKTHSAKPDGFYDLVERACTGPYLEMFARRARFGWDYWGDESHNTTEAAA